MSVSSTSPDRAPASPPRRFDLPLWLLTGGFLVIGGLFALTLSTATAQRDLDGWVLHTLKVQDTLSRSLSDLQDAETGERGYIITGRPDFLGPYDVAMENLDADLSALATQVADNPSQRAAAVRLKAVAGRRLDLLRQAIALRRSGDVAAAASIVSQGEGKRLMDQARGVVAGMRAAEDALLVTRQGRAQAAFDQLRLILIVGLAVVMMVTLVFVRDSWRRLNRLAASRDALIALNGRLIAEAANREAAEAQVRQLQKMESLGQLTGGIAHDFNNMLSVVIGSLDLARRRLKTDPDRAEAFIGAALEGARRAAALTSRLLAFARQQPLAPVVSDPNRLVATMSELLRRTLGEPYRLETVLAGGVWRVNVDVSQLENALVNLCVNARDAMPDGGRLTLETANAHLDDAYAAQNAEVQPGQYVLISVTDTGVGMPPSVIDKAFDPFFTTKPVGKGTGLGLSQVFGFVKQSGGHLKIYSEIDVGTAVKVYLPRWLGDAVAPAAPGPADLAASVNHETILVVEDDLDVQRVTVHLLRDLGYHVIHAGSAEEALRILEQPDAVDLLFTDVVMPGMTGRALADRAAVGRPSMPVLFTTGYTRNAVVHNGVLDEGVAFLAKPFTSE